ncbi:hypothetical protein [Thermococcus sp. AM4]|uniref:hypothetical protein n=1 Tax=Thermococcus sp. (strain AM4) TaxID=246969 RepID=UPI0001870BFE|nr:hypothetical protein [Thermococcus sp. AM4]EEB74674.1 hypothetical protein TAM4_619 [Thermococcus sp. AM4]
MISEEHAKYIAPTKEDAQRWTLLLQLLSILPAMENKIRRWKELGKRQEHLLKNLAEEEVAYYHKENVKEIAGEIELPKNLLPYEGYILPKYEKLKDPEFRKRFVTGFVDSHNIWIKKSRILTKYLPLAMEAVEELVKYLGPEGRNWIETEEYKNLEKLNKYLDTLFGEEYGAKPRSTTATRAAIPSAAVRPSQEPAKPTFPETKKAVEEELRKAGIPEEKGTKVFTELITIAKALEYAGFSGEAMKRAEGDLLNRLDELLENPEENALEIAYTVKLLRLVQRRDVEGIREFAK